MIKRSTLIATAILATAALGALAAPGCSSKTEETGGTVTPPSTESVQPNKRPTAKATGTTKWFALNKLKLGLTDKATGKADAKAWQQYGYDLDSRYTTVDDSPTSKNSCKRRSGSPTKVLADGPRGVDNNFGQHVMAVIKSLKADAEEAVTQSLTDGKFTLLLKIENMTDGDNAAAPGFLYVANDFGGDTPKPPTFTEADKDWQILAASLEDGKTIGKPKLSFPSGYVSGGYWVSGDFGTGTINLNISLSGADISLPIDSGIITMKADGSDGTIAGAMNTDKLKDALTPVARRFGICPGNATYDQVVETLTQSADLVSGAPNLQDTSKECTAISLALGFNAKLTGDHSAAKVKAAPTDPGPDECSEAEGGVSDGGTKTDAATGG